MTQDFFSKWHLVGMPDNGRVPKPKVWKRRRQNNTGRWGVVNTVDPRLCSRVSVEYVKFLIPEVTVAIPLNKENELTSLPRSRHVPATSLL